jgi:serine protease
MERGWNLNHEDLAGAGITLISGISNDFFFHGTSVLGEVLMVDNSVGGVGVAPSATGRLVSQWRTAANYNTVDAILDAVAHMAFETCCCSKRRTSIRSAVKVFGRSRSPALRTRRSGWPTAIGIVVVEAGSNGSNDLDVYTDASGATSEPRRVRGNRRGGGRVLVAARNARNAEYVPQDRHDHYSVCAGEQRAHSLGRYRLAPRVASERQAGTGQNSPKTVDHLLMPGARSIIA